MHFHFSTIAYGWHYTLTMRTVFAFRRAETCLSHRNVVPTARNDDRVMICTAADTSRSGNSFCAFVRHADRSDKTHLVEIVVVRHPLW